MTDRNKTTFNQVNDLVFETIVTAFSESVQGERQEAEIVAQELTDGFFKKLALGDDFREYFNVEQGAFGDYAPLAEDWRYRKLKRRITSDLSDNAFYFGLGKRGHLQNAVARQSAAKRFGAPKVDFRQGATPGGPEISTASGRPRIAKGQKGAGRFAPYQSIQTTITIELFPKVSANKSDEGALGLLGKSKWAMKLASLDQGTENIPERPLFTPYFDWYTQVYMPQEIRRRIR